VVILYFGDIFGKVGRCAVRTALPDIIADHTPDFILGNAENLHGGRGINRKCFNELIEMGFHGVTAGNHTWDNRELLNWIDSEERVLRPANYPSPPDDPCPGRGYGVICAGDKRLFVINLMGRVFMDDLDCPFAKVDQILKDNPTPFPVFVDMHADATSEKYAMAWHLAGRVSVLVGSHSHVQTADERLLPGGTAYITDAGMNGAFDSVIGMRPAEVIRRFRTKRPFRYEPGNDNPGVSYVVVKLDPRGKALSIQRFRYTVKLPEALLGDLE